MKKTLVLFVGLFIVSFTMQGQAAILAMLFGDKVASEKFNLSLELGGTFSNYSNLENTEKSDLGINFGIGGNLKLSENWFFSPNIYFLARRNFQLNEFSLVSGNEVLNTQFMNVPTEVTLNYIDVPIFFSYQTNNKKYRFSLAPKVSFLQKSRGLFNNSEGEFTQNIDGYAKDIDYGVVGDIGFIFGKAHKGKGVHLHLRYYYGFTDVLNDQISANYNRSSYLSFHLSLPFITDALAAKNLQED